MKVEVCEDNGLMIECYPIKKSVELKGGNKVLLTTRNGSFEVDKSNYRVFEKWIVWPIWKRSVIRYFAKSVPADGIQRDDYLKLKQVELTEKMLLQHSMFRQMQLLILLMVIMAIAFAVVIGIIGSRPTHVEVVVPQPTATETAPPQQPPVLPPPG